MTERERSSPALIGGLIGRTELQFRDAVASHNPFNLNATAHKWMELAMIGIGSRRQAVHAETFTGMKVF